MKPEKQITYTQLGKITIWTDTMILKSCFIKKIIFILNVMEMC